MTMLVVAEKPSVARDIAQVLGARTRGSGFFQGPDVVVTWAIGHLVALAEPHQMNPAWKRWRSEDLPLLPHDWPLVVVENTKDQYAVVARWLKAKEIKRVVCATDAGREGELIFRYIYEAARATKPVQRLWISSLTESAIRDGFRRLQDQREFHGLADAARGRSRADWLVGMNLSRLYSIRSDANYSVGRVQTPTLAMIVARDLEIRAFVPEHYLEVVASFTPPDGAAGSYLGTYALPGVPAEGARRLPANGELAAEIVERARTGKARIASVDRQVRKLPPPLLYDLTELQRHANRLFGFTAQRTLQLAQNLYEQRKLLSYPRTDSRHVSRTVAETFPGIVSAIADRYRGLVAEGSGARPLGSRFVDDARVSDHHALLPTETRPGADLPVDERRLYDLVCRRFLSAWHGDHVFAVTNVKTEIHAKDAVDPYFSSGTSIEDEGWKVLDLGTRQETALPGGLAKGQERRVVDPKAVKKTTRPPPRFTDATLLTAMETAGSTLDEKELSRAMRERGLGTPATRAAILETLLKREYVVRDAKTLVATDKGIELIDVVHPHVKSPAMTGEWEAKLARIERGEGDLPTFMREIERYVREVTGASSSSLASGSRATGLRPLSFEDGPPGPAEGPSWSGVSTRAPARDGAGTRGEQPARAEEVEPEPRGTGGGAPFPSSGTREKKDMQDLLRGTFGFSSFRPYQEDVCRAAASGQDVLLVMPTGAGKSLCYQLPGLSRGGTTLVVSPLIALMEDQVAQLVRRGLRAERIHSGRPRLESRAVCKAYLEGLLDFLFIAPERLKVPGFPEMLARRKPSLIAIDEAHCISQWGHDFRPDYRMLGERLPLLRPAPIIALTATATPTVQRDIASELRLTSAQHFIHGFRRTNIGVEVIERGPSERAAVVKRLLGSAARRPAIVYAPTRKEAEKLAKSLPGAAPYHAGLSAPIRDHVQSAFIAGNLEIIVATTAFGMGIDKPDVRTVIHTAIPSTLEGYYQEIGRAGRDGKPSRAVLLHSFVDTKTHEFFLERDYPEPEILERVQRAIEAGSEQIADIARRAQLDVDVVEKAVEKLWVHGGALVGADDSVRPGTGAWKQPYDLQRAHKREQLVRMRRYAETASCRMLQLIAHFGDEQDGGAACGSCDVCAPGECIAQSFREPSAGESAAAAKVLEALRERDGRAIGQLHRDLFEDVMDRRALEHVLGGLARAGAIRIAADTFEKDGVTIPFQRVHLVSGGNTMRPVRVVVRAPAKDKVKRAKGASRKKRPRGVAAAPPGSSLEAALRAWRSVEARKRRVPAFRVLTDKTIMGIATERPKDVEALLRVSGIGHALAEKYGRQLLAIVARS